METEEVFDIAISDREAEKLVCVRDLAALVSRRIPLVRGEPCRTRRAFAQARRVLRRLRVPRAAVVPGASLLELSPILAHPDVWPLFGRALGGRVWPTLPRERAWRKLRLAEELPYGLRTVGEVARHLATESLEESTCAWNRETILLRVRRLVADQMQVESFPDDARFADDLGCG